MGSFFQGAVMVELKDQSYMVGFAGHNRFTGILRHFSETNELMTITSAATGL